jgi:hypothetical protein
MGLGVMVALGVLLTAGCAGSAIWLSGHAPLVETYTGATVRIYRAGAECRVEVVTAAATVITLPTRCVTAPHVPKPEEP